MLGSWDDAVDPVRGLGRHRERYLRRHLLAKPRLRVFPDFATRALTTPEGWTLIIVGCGVGFLFAIVALCVSVVSFPLMLDRHASADTQSDVAVAVIKNPVAMAAWADCCGVLLVLGSVPASSVSRSFCPCSVMPPGIFIGRWSSRTRILQHEQPRPPKGHRYAADFPANLFPWSRER